MSTIVTKLAQPPQDILLCISASFGRARPIDSVIPKDIFPDRYLSDTDPVTELREAKESGRAIVLVVLGPNAHDGIKYLCDDYEKPTEERRVKWIHSCSAGIDWYRLKELQKEVCGIPFTNGKGGYSYHLALHTLYSILYFNRETARLLENKHARRWDMFDMVELRGQKVAIIGYGDIGRAAAKMLQPLLMSAIGVKRSLTESEANTFDEHGVLLVSGDAARDQAIAESDYVVNVLPATEATKGLFNRAMFAKMKKNAVYINIGRGSTQNEMDLCEALSTGIIAGASLDVFETEPLPSTSPLFDVPDNKLLITPHNACITANSFRETIGIFASSAREYLSAGTIRGYHPNVSSGY